ncbi:MAG: glycosyltransferase family 4 protein, partial [Candidatus Levybacteria bacterium]|nr:glycosyltransferase family 4 protein [Candidatus Levybacteria bacterium]
MSGVRIPSDPHFAALRVIYFMNVLFLTRRFYPDIGGVEKHVLEVSKELVKRGHEVTVITENSFSLKLRGVNTYHSEDQSDTYSINSNKAVKSIQIDHSELKKIKVLRLNFGKENSFKKFRVWLRLLRHTDTIKKSSVVHCHDVFFWYLPFRFLFPFKKVFTTFHGYETIFPPSTKARLLRKISEKLSYGNICIGDFIKKWYGTKPDYVTYGG